MDADVIEVAVTAVGVVDRQQVGVLLPEDFGQPGGGEVDIDAGEAAGRCDGSGVVGPARVLEAQVLDARAAEDRRAAAQLLEPPGRGTSAATRESVRPAAPDVATTSTTRCPASASIASVPPVSSASSSGCAWKDTIVCGAGISLPPPVRACGTSPALAGTALRRRS